VPPSYTHTVVDSGRERERENKMIEKVYRLGADSLGVVGEVFVKQHDAHEFGKIGHVQTHLILSQFAVQLHHPSQGRRRQLGFYRNRGYRDTLRIAQYTFAFATSFKLARKLFRLVCKGQTTLSF
jgi:hypothetical protein